MKPPRGTAPSVLVVEDRAHRPVGHSPVRFAELAAGFAALGFHVEALTSRGWYLGGEVHAGFPVHRYGPTARVLSHVADRLTRNSRHASVRGWLRRGGELLRVVVMIGAARARRRQMPASTAVVIVSNCDAPMLTAAIAGSGRWLAYVFLPPHAPTTSWGARRDQLVARVAQRAEHRRRARGECCVVAAPSESLRAAWAASSPALEVVVAAIAGSGEAHAVPDARQQLGLDSSLRVALLFGSAYPEKDPGAVFRSFEQLNEWQLVTAGTLADAIPPSARVHRIPGFVDARTRGLLYAAADLVVLSFTPGFVRNSGTLMDAITWGVPVVCSDRSAPADLVREYRLGTIFEPGNAEALTAAVRAAPREIDPANLARARTELSSRAVAERAADALGIRS